VNNMPKPILAPIVSAAVRNVLQTQFSLPIEALETLPAMATGYAATLYGSVVLFGSRVRGDICLSLPDALADTLVARMLGLPESSAASDADKRDLAGEFCNMLSGQIGAALTDSGYLNDLGTPQVTRERADLTDAGPSESRFEGGWACAGHPFSLSLSLRFDPYESQDPQR
jgi:CheY-specific phosphatase CheX